MISLSQLRARIDNQMARSLVQSRLSVETAKPLVSFTFDDALETALSNGASILEQYGVRGTFYISGRLAGCVETDRQFISLQGCSDLAARGHEIGCHTFGHQPVWRMSRNMLDEDLERNAFFRAQVTPGLRVRNFAYPYNQASLRCASVLRRRFRSARAGRSAINRGIVNALHLNAVEIAQPEDEARYAAWIDSAADNPGWLIFFTHDVSDQPTAFGSTPRLFERLVARALAKGCDVVTIEEALDRLGAPDLVAPL